MKNSITLYKMGEITSDFIQFELPDVCKKPSITKWVPSIYQFDELIKLKHELNDVKNKLNPINNIKYIKITAVSYVGEDLRGDHGRLSAEFNAQIVTKAWMKIHELFNRYVIFEREIKRKLGGGIISKVSSPIKDLYTFHIAEAPGAFIPSINHIIRTKYPSIDWNWFAESYRDPILSHDRKRGKYFGDQYGLMKKYDSQWIYGAENDGDITKGSNIRWFRHHIGEYFPRLDVITSDVKFVPTVDFNFDDEEIYNIAVHAGHTITALATLSKGGTAILKTFTFFESASISLLYLLGCSFERVLITKPMTSTPANSETYLVCLGFLNNITPMQLDILYEYLIYCRENPKNPAALFPKSQIPKEFVEKIVEIGTALKKRQIEYIDRNINLYNEYQNKPISVAEKDTAKVRHTFAEKYITTYNVEPIDEKDWL